MTAEAIIVPFPKRAPRALVRASQLVGAVLLLWIAVELVSFAKHVVHSGAMEPCPADVERRVRAQFFTDYERWWGRPVYGVESGSFHAYGGPGGTYFRMGVGGFALEASHPMCS